MTCSVLGALIGSCGRGAGNYACFTQLCNLNFRGAEAREAVADATASDDSSALHKTRPATWNNMSWTPVAPLAWPFEWLRIRRKKRCGSSSLAYRCCMLACMTRQLQKKLQRLEFVAGLYSSPHFTACCDIDVVCSATLRATLSRLVSFATPTYLLATLGRCVQLAHCCC